MYITYSEYTALYDPIEEKVFNRLEHEARRYVDRMTTGADGVRKLRVAYPTDADSVETIRHCVASVINILHEILEAEQSASSGRGYVETQNGLQGKVISSVSSGNESISFSTGSGMKTVIDAAVSDISSKNDLIFREIRDRLSGVPDANGVNLLYMGIYPR